MLFSVHNVTDNFGHEEETCNCPCFQKDVSVCVCDCVCENQKKMLYHNAFKSNRKAVLKGVWVLTPGIVLMLSIALFFLFIMLFLRFVSYKCVFMIAIGCKSY